MATKAETEQVIDELRQKLKATEILLQQQQTPTNVVVHTSTESKNSQKRMTSTNGMIASKIIQRTRR